MQRITNLIDIEKWQKTCWKMSIRLQKSALIQKSTSPPKFAAFCWKIPNFTISNLSIRIISSGRFSFSTKSEISSRSVSNTFDLKKNSFILRRTSWESLRLVTSPEMLRAAEFGQVHLRPPLGDRRRNIFRAARFSRRSSRSWPLSQVLWFFLQKC